MSPEDKFDHAVTVRNRTMGPKATELSPYLDVEVTEDNKRFLNIKPHDINMYHVLQQSTCRHGDRRKVARRSLTALGGVSGVCGILNGDEQMKGIKAGLKFAASLEEIKHADKVKKALVKEQNKKKKEAALVKKKQQQAVAKEKRAAAFAAALTKLGLGKDDPVQQSHVAKLSGPQLRAVAFVQCGGLVLKGKVGDMRDRLKPLLPADSGTVPDESYPEYATQDDQEDFESSGDTTESEHIQLEQLAEGDIVEVYWEGEHEWFEGEVTGICMDDRQFEVSYTDGAKLWHKVDEYPVRLGA